MNIFVLRPPTTLVDISQLTIECPHACFFAIKKKWKEHHLPKKVSIDGRCRVARPDAHCKAYISSSNCWQDAFFQILVRIIQLQSIEFHFPQFAYNFPNGPIYLPAFVLMCSQSRFWRQQPINPSHDGSFEITCHYWMKGWSEINLNAMLIFFPYLPQTAMNGGLLCNGRRVTQQHAADSYVNTHVHTFNCQRTAILLMVADVGIVHQNTHNGPFMQLNQRWLILCGCTGVEGNRRATITDASGHHHAQQQQSHSKQPVSFKLGNNIRQSW